MKIDVHLRCRPSENLLKSRMHNSKQKSHVIGYVSPSHTLTLHSKLFYYNYHIEYDEILLPMTPIDIII